YYERMRTVFLTRSTDMKIEDTIDEQVPASSPTHPKRKSWLASIGAILVVMLVVGASAIVFAQLEQHHKNQSQSQKQGKAIPPGGNWVQVLNGYALTSLL